MKRNVPRLRFKEFDDEWKEKKLGKLGESLIGLTYSPDDITDKDNGILVLRSSNVQNGKLTFSDNVFVNCKIKEKIKVKDNDILICSRNGSKALIGKSALIKNLDAEATFGAFMTIFRCENGQFIHQLINTREFFKQINMNLGATINQITSNNLNNFKFSIPSLQEQEKIANFLTKVDSLIEEQDGKVKDLELYKKGMMQKIFSQDIRFKDDNGCEYPEWEEKMLGDVALIQMGQSPSSDAYNENFEGIPLIQGNADIQERKTAPRTYTSEITKTCEIGEIIMSVRAPVGTIAKSYHKACIGRGVCSIKNKINNEYLYQILLNQEDKWSKLSQGSTFDSINRSDINSLKCYVPCLEEQTKIANFLSNIDLIIEEENNKLQDLRQWKKGLLQQMFV